MANPMDNLIKIDHKKPPRMVIYGAGGIGKTTFCANAPRPVFIQTEDGLGSLQVPAFPLCETYEDFKKYINFCISENHDYKTVVIDSADWLEQLIHKKVCIDQNEENIADIAYGRGYKHAATIWRSVLDLLNKLRDKGCIPVFTAHPQIVKVEDPRQGDYDQFTLKLHKDACALLKEWADLNFYASYDMHIKKEDAGFGATKGRAVGGETRIIRTVGRPTYEAKSRYALPEVLPLNWQAFEQAYRVATAPQQSPKKGDK